MPIISSVALPKVANKSPPIRSPVCSAICSTACPINAARGRIPKPATRKMSKGGRCKTSRIGASTVKMSKKYNQRGINIFLHFIVALLIHALFASTSKKRSSEHALSYVIIREYSPKNTSVIIRSTTSMSSGHQWGASEKADTSSFNNGHHEPEHPLIILSRRFLDRGDSFIYAIVGICFFLGAIFTLGYCFWDFGSTIFNVQGLVNTVTTPQSIVAGAIIKLVSDLLLVLIIME